MPLTCCLNAHYHVDENNVKILMECRLTVAEMTLNIDKMIG